jgi:hypothetical protein
MARRGVHKERATIIEKMLLKRFYATPRGIQQNRLKSAETYWFLLSDFLIHNYL